MEKPSWDDLRSWYDEMQSKITITDGELLFSHGAGSEADTIVSFKTTVQDLSSEAALYLNFDGIYSSMGDLGRWRLPEFSEPEYDSLNISTAVEKNVVVDHETDIISSEYDFGHKLIHDHRIKLERMVQ